MKGDFRPSWVRIELKNLLIFIGFMCAEFITPHGFRKGFNTYLSGIGVNDGRIASAGRWWLWAAFHRYCIYAKHDAIVLCKELWSGKKPSSVIVDFDDVRPLFMKYK